MCAFRLIISPLEFGLEFTKWLADNNIEDNMVGRVENVPTPFDYYPRLVCFNLRSGKAKYEVWIESLSVNEVHTMLKPENYVTIQE